MYSEDDLLPLSALQHLLFCERQCAFRALAGDPDVPGRVDRARCMLSGYGGAGMMADTFCLQPKSLQPKFRSGPLVPRAWRRDGCLRRATIRYCISAPNLLIVSREYTIIGLYTPRRGRPIFVDVVSETSSCIERGQSFCELKSFIPIGGEGGRERAGKDSLNRFSSNLEMPVT